MHLVLSKEYPPQQEAVYTTSPNIAIELLATGVVTKISFSESWCRTHDPEIQVARFMDQQVREAAIPMLKPPSDLGLPDAASGRRSGHSVAS